MKFFDLHISSPRKKLLLLFIALVLLSRNIFALGEASYIETRSARGSFPLFDGAAAAILADTNDWPGVGRAATDLALDVQRVTGHNPEIFRELKSAGINDVIVGTIGKSKFIDQLAREKKIDVST